MRSFDSAFSESMLAGYQAGVMAYEYRGVRCLKSPIDIAITMRVLWDLRPGLVLEIGSHSGGSALLLADLLTTFGIEAPVISVDLEPPTDISDPRITFVRGSVHDLDAVIDDLGLDAHPHPWFVNEDSAHTYQGCMDALAVLNRRMRSGDLLAMEDGILDELGLSDRYSGGPNRAIAAFLTENPGAFQIAPELCDMFGQNATYNPNGYLRKL